VWTGRRRPGRANASTKQYRASCVWRRVRSQSIRRGFNKNSLKIGTEIVVDGYQSKDLSNRANGRDVTFTDGRKLFLGSSGTGAPKDGKDPTER